MKKFLLAALLLLAPTLARADELQTAFFMIRYDVDSSSVSYCRVTGQNGSPFGGAIEASGAVATAGSSTTATCTACFGPLAVNDIIQVTKPTGAVDTRRVLAKASDSSLTLDEAATWTGGFTWRYFKTSCGTADSDGWIDVEGATSSTLTVEFNQGDITNLEWRIEAIATTGANSLRGIPKPAIIYPGTNTACGASGTVASGYCRFAAATVGITGRHPVLDITDFRSIRLGFRFDTADASDAAANLEVVTAYITKRMPR